MSNESDDSREHGVEFGALAEDLENLSYPLSHEELLNQYGDRELELVGESTTLSEILAPENEREYEDAEGVRQAIFNMVGEEAVGREGYTDRGGEGPDVAKTDEAESL